MIINFFMLVSFEMDNRCTGYLNYYLYIEFDDL